jgi:hypothetical protein
MALFRGRGIGAFAPNEIDLCQVWSGNHWGCACMTCVRVSRLLLRWGVVRARRVQLRPGEYGPVLPYPVDDPRPCLTEID